MPDFEGAGSFGRPLVDQLVEAFLSSLRARNLSNHTLRAYEHDVREFLAELLERGVSRLAIITRVHLTDHAERLLERGLSSASRARRFAALRTFFSWAVEFDHLLSAPTDSVRIARQPKRIPALLSQADMTKLLGQPDHQSFLGSRDRAALEFLYSTGARAAELCSLDRNAVDFSRGVVRILGKGKKERLAVLGRPAVAAMRAYDSNWRRPVAYAGHGRAFFLTQEGMRMNPRTLRRLVIENAKRAGIKGRVHTHMIRHSFATHLMDNGADLLAVQELLGHSSVVTTQVYVHVSVGRLLETYDRCHPRSGKLPPANLTPTFPDFDT